MRARRQFWDWEKSRVTENLTTLMNKNTRFAGSEKQRHALSSVKIAWTNEQRAVLEVIVISYGQNKDVEKNEAPESNRN